MLLTIRHLHTIVVYFKRGPIINKIESCVVDRCCERAGETVLTVSIRPMTTGGTRTAMDGDKRICLFSASISGPVCHNSLQLLEARKEVSRVLADICLES